MRSVTVAACLVALLALGACGQGATTRAATGGLGGAAVGTVVGGPVGGLYLNCGWSYGGFKATPASGWCFAHLIARDEPYPAAALLRLDRYATGALIDERGAGAQPNLH